jgi:hypothetical protein
MDPSNRETSFRNTGAVEQDRPEQKTNVASMNEQLDHRDQDPLNKASDSGMGGTGQTPEFTGENGSKNQLEKDTGADLSEDGKKKLEHASHAMNRMDTPGRSNSEEGEPDEEVNQDPGERQKENQNEKKDDDLAA